MLGVVIARMLYQGDNMPEKKRQKKQGQDKGKKNQARRRGARPTSSMTGRGRQRTATTEHE